MNNLASPEVLEKLKAEGLNVNEPQKERMAYKINDVLTYEPRIGIFGKTGVGKSSLCNALFGKEIAKISDISACTRNPQEIFLKIGTAKGIKLIDVPGVGENRDRDMEYAELYKNLLPELDLVLWLLKADDRAFSIDEEFYKKIVKPHLEQGKPFFIIINQVDKMEPIRQWDTKRRSPGVEQNENIKDKISVVSRFFDLPVSKILAVSAVENYNLLRIVDEVVFALPNDKKITFVQNVHQENISQAAVEDAESGLSIFLGDIVDFAGEAIDGALDLVIDVTEGAIDIVEVVVSGVADVVGDVWDSITGNCFITTAACLALGKDDNCYELNTLRAYRDYWLLEQEDGERLIKAYYKIAPKIVCKINENENSMAIYRFIWGEYLEKCITLIEDLKFEEAKKLYIQMMNFLRSLLCRPLVEDELLYKI